MDIEKVWWESFGNSYGVEFEKARPNYQTLDKNSQMIGALVKLELDMHNGGFLQFFCNWGYSAYLLALGGLESIKATQARSILQNSYSILEPYENDTRLGQLWDMATILSDEEQNELDRLDQKYWEDEDGVMGKMLVTFSENM